MILDVEVARVKATMWKFQGKGLVDDELAVEAELMLAMRRLD